MKVYVLTELEDIEHSIPELFGTWVFRTLDEAKAKLDERMKHWWDEYDFDREDMKPFNGDECFLTNEDGCTWHKVEDGGFVENYGDYIHLNIDEFDI